MCGAQGVGWRRAWCRSEGIDGREREEDILQLVAVDDAVAVGIEGRRHGLEALLYPAAVAAMRGDVQVSARHTRGHHDQRRAGQAPEEGEEWAGAWVARRPHANSLFDTLELIAVVAAQ